MKKVLTIAGSDCSGGAGIQADLKTMIINGVYGMSAITALTAQNTTGVDEIMAVTPDFLGKQLDSIFTDIFPDAVKIGMLFSKDLVSVTARKLKQYSAGNIVVDPVMVATSGSSLTLDETVIAMERELFPMARLITPNIPEATRLWGHEINTKDDMEAAAYDLANKYGCSVLVKGGHLTERADDFLYCGNKSCWILGERVHNPNTHGTGCTLSSAIATNLAQGADVEESVRRAKEYLAAALRQQLDLGKGSGPLDHLAGTKAFEEYEES